MNGKIYLVDTENPGGSLDIASRTADALQTGDAMYLFVTPELFRNPASCRKARRRFIGSMLSRCSPGRKV